MHNLGLRRIPNPVPRPIGMALSVAILVVVPLTEGARGVEYAALCRSGGILIRALAVIQPVSRVVVPDIGLARDKTLKHTLLKDPFHVRI